MRLPIPGYPLDVVLRGHYAKTDYEDHGALFSDVYGYYDATVYSEGVLVISNEKQTGYGGSLQIQWNLGTNDFVNPYIAAGVMYEQYEVKHDLEYTEANRMTLGWLSTSWLEEYAWEEKVKDHGSAFVGRVGVELFPNPMYFRAEASWVSELYEDDAQAELEAIGGINLSPNVRLDIAGTYYTEWKDYYVTAGLTFSL